MLGLNTIHGFGWSEFVFLVILSELIVKCILGFGSFVRILGGPTEMVERAHYFHYVPMGLLDFGGLNFVFLTIFSELRVQMYRQ
jgi:hypothetical protein